MILLSIGVVCLAGSTMWFLAHRQAPAPAMAPAPAGDVRAAAPPEAQGVGVIRIPAPAPFINIPGAESLPMRLTLLAKLRVEYAASHPDGHYAPDSPNAVLPPDDWTNQRLAELKQPWRIRNIGGAYSIIEGAPPAGAPPASPSTAATPPPPSPAPPAN